MFVKQETDACLYLAHSDDGQTKMETNMDYNYLHETKTNIETKPTIKDEPDELMDSTNDAQSPLLDPGPSSSCLYDDHQVKEEMVLGPTVLYKPILNSAAGMNDLV
ncbi:hypothetical protein O0L34_g1762 [Tuta absoluta]|nr:hypothetical protein O0L34_g1762 [Tuta absoluta]